MNGPSLPVDSPDINIVIRPRHFAKKVFQVRTLFNFNPFKIAFNSGIPEPAAYWDMNLTEANEASTNTKQDVIQIKQLSLYSSLSIYISIVYHNYWLTKYTLMNNKIYKYSGRCSAYC